MDQAGASSGSQASGMTIASPATAMPTIVNSVVTGARATKVSIIAASTIHTTGVSTSKRKPKRLRAASAAVDSVTSRASHAGPAVGAARSQGLGIPVGDNRDRPHWNQRPV